MAPCLNKFLTLMKQNFTVKGAIWPIGEIFRTKIVYIIFLQIMKSLFYTQDAQTYTNITY